MNKKAFINKRSSPRNVVGDLRLIKLLYKKAFSLFNTTKSAEDSPQRHWGMTLCYEQRAFTLIELLVVVLIVGILSAIALPQYQKAVWKARSAQLHTAVAATVQAQQSYFLANGKYASEFDDLDIDFSLPNTNSAGLTATPKGSRSNDHFSIVINYIPSVGTSIAGMFNNGPYKYSGLIFNLDGGEIKQKLSCIENITSCPGCCHKLFGTSQIANSTDGAWNWYIL